MSPQPQKTSRAGRDLPAAIGVGVSLGVAAAARPMRLSPRAAMFLAALLTFGAFAALVLWIMVGNAEGGGW